MLKIEDENVFIISHVLRFSIPVLYSYYFVVFYRLFKYITYEYPYSWSEDEYSALEYEYPWNCWIEYEWE